ncbi:hypothetical protein PCANC_28871 [Puccinia coronata f. sp. avenae]|uniref:Uncharacterized protein n=1 Tax=Puccinia coronata f. sp. avenae TaxID=200324 RepID=A0A2N5S1P7_9BASI|nr:hypothetical protein PCANC_28871 [Puccinia coronata f. sp. avenae]
MQPTEGLQDPCSHSASPQGRLSSVPLGSSRPIPDIKIQNTADKAKPNKDDFSTKDYLCLLMAAQHASIVQAQQEQEASAARIARLEETLIALSFQRNAQPTPPCYNETDCINLQRFKTLDGPIFNGPFQAIEPFFKWIHGIQIFFATKDVRHDGDKIWIAGSLIQETNTLAFPASSINNLVTGTWDSFKAALFDFALPPLWRTTLRQKNPRALPR